MIKRKQVMGYALTPIEDPIVLIVIEYTRIFCFSRDSGGFFSAFVHPLGTKSLYIERELNDLVAKHEKKALFFFDYMGDDFVIRNIIRCKGGIRIRTLGIYARMLQTSEAVTIFDNEWGREEFFIDPKYLDLSKMGGLDGLLDLYPSYVTKFKMLLSVYKKILEVKSNGK